MKEKLQNRNYFKVIIFIVVLCIPIIYSFFYLKSYWDPYGKLADMDVAIVNLDKGKKGKELVNKLIEKDTLKINEVTEEEASKGLAGEKYYATITIPSNFTECLESAQEENKQIATLTYRPNQKFNYLASQIINRVVTAAETEVQNEVSKEVVATLSDNLREVPESLEKIENGADKLSGGATSLRDGLKRIRDGNKTLDEKYKQFDQGLQSAYEGSKSLEDGTKQVTSGVKDLARGGKTLETALTQINSGAETLSSASTAGMEQLVRGISDLDDGATTLKAGVNSYVDGTDELAAGLKQYVTGVDTLNGNVKALLQSLVAYGNSPAADATTKQLAASAKAILESGSMDMLTASGSTLKAGANQITSNSQALKAGVSSLKTGTKTLKDSTSSLQDLTDGIDSLKQAIRQVEDGSKTLNSGLDDLQEGTDSLETGSQTLRSGLALLKQNSSNVQEALDALKEGSKAAYDGSKTLARGSETFENEITNGREEAEEELTKLDGLDSHVKEAVEVEEEPYGEVTSYGIAFTPLFLCIGLWVGALMCYVVLYYDQEKRFGILVRNSGANRIIQNIAYLGISIVMGLVTGFLLKVGLHLTPVSTGIYYLECMIIAFTFMSIIQFLIKNLGDIGKFLGLIILVLQLASSGGTFPVPLIDKMFQSMSNFLPMTYAIKIVKDLLIKTDTSFLLKNTGILLSFAAICIIITAIIDVAKIKQAKKIKE